jgi:hypothetical protein
VQTNIPIRQSGWCLLRASSDQPEHPVLDDYVYATTSPIYVRVEGVPRKPGTDAVFFITWIDRLLANVKADKNWNTDQEKASTLKTLQDARQVFVELQP